MNEYGYHLVIHSDKPQVLEPYLKIAQKMHSNQNNTGLFEETVLSLPTKEAALYMYQVQTNRFMFQDLLHSEIPIIFDRTHLGEMVYAPLYRKYSGEYIYEIEKETIEPQDQKDIRMILLTTSNFDMLEDDGLSFDFSKKEDEQKMFIDAFNRSIIENKVIVDVHNGKGGYKTYEEIFQEATK